VNKQHTLFGFLLVIFTALHCTKETIPLRTFYEPNSARINFNQLKVGQKNYYQFANFYSAPTAYFHTKYKRDSVGYTENGDTLLVEVVAITDTLISLNETFTSGSLHVIPPNNESPSAPSTQLILKGDSIVVKSTQVISIFLNYDILIKKYNYSALYFKKANLSKSTMTSVWKTDLHDIEDTMLLRAELLGKVTIFNKPYEQLMLHRDHRQFAYSRQDAPSFFFNKQYGIVRSFFLNQVGIYAGGKGWDLLP
jgi:hypothetical protein